MNISFLEARFRRASYRIQARIDRAWLSSRKETFKEALVYYTEIAAKLPGRIHPNDDRFNHIMSEAEKHKVRHMCKLYRL